MEVNFQYPQFTLVQHQHRERQTRVHSQFMQQHMQCSYLVHLLQRFCKTLYSYTQTTLIKCLLHVSATKCLLTDNNPYKEAIVKDFN